MPKYRTNIASPVRIEKSPIFEIKSGFILSANNEIGARIHDASIKYASNLFQKETAFFVSILPQASVSIGSSYGAIKSFPGSKRSMQEAGRINTYKRLNNAELLFKNIRLTVNNAKIPAIRYECVSFPKTSVIRFLLLIKDKM